MKSGQQDFSDSAFFFFLSILPLLFFGWNGFDFPSSSPCSIVLYICGQNSIDNTPVWWLLLSHSSKAFPPSSPHSPQSPVGCAFLLATALPVRPCVSCGILLLSPNAMHQPPLSPPIELQASSCIYFKLISCIVSLQSISAQSSKKLLFLCLYLYHDMPTADSQQAQQYLLGQQLSTSLTPEHPQLQQHRSPNI